MPNQRVRRLPAAFTASKLGVPVIVCFVVALVHLILRLQLPNYIFDDTRHIYAGWLASGGLEPHLGWSRLFDIIHDEFANDTPREYRPLSFIQHSILVALYSPNYMLRPVIPTIIVSVGWGLLAAVHFVFARRVLVGTCAAALSTLLFITAMPIVTGSWIVIMGWQWVVSLAILAGLMFYQNYKAEPRAKWLVLIVLTTLIGSWFREYSGLFVFICLANELLFERRRSTMALVVLTACAFHVIFPAFLPNLFLHGQLHDIALTPVFKMGPIAAVSNGGASLLSLTDIRWDALYHFLLLFPPLLWLLAVAGAASTGWSQPRVFILSESITDRAAAFLSAKLVRSTLAALLVITLLGVAAAVVTDKFGTPYVASALALFFLATFYILPRSPLLAIYAVASLLPFLKVYTHEVHLSYAVAPMAIILVAMLRELAAGDFRVLRYLLGRAARPVVVGLVIVIALDGTMNVMASFRAVNAVYAGIRDRAVWLQQHVPKGSVVVGNFIDLRDMLLYAPKHFEPYFSIIPNWEPNQVETPDKLIALIDSPSRTAPVYLLGAVFQRQANKYAYHHLHYLEAVDQAAEQRFYFVTDVRYPYADPLKYFVPDSLTSYPGPPDLVDDYWVGRDQTGSPFVREFRTEYLLARVDALSESQRALLRVPPLGIVEAYRGFNILHWRSDRIEFTAQSGAPQVTSHYLVLSQSAGAVNPLDLERDRRYAQCAADGRCFVVRTLACAHGRIDALLAEMPAPVCDQ